MNNVLKLRAIIIWCSCLALTTTAFSQATPIIQSVSLSSAIVTNGGQVTVTVIAQSDSPVNWINRRLDSPTGNIYGGGGSWPSWTQLDANHWQCQWTETISRYAPSGTYTLSNVSCRNEAQLTSNIWQTLTFTVSNSIAPTAPAIQSITLSKSSIINGGQITITVIAQSESPVNWINRRLDSPTANIYGGGGSWPPWTQLDVNRWQCQWTETISQYAPSGTYTLSNVSCRNEAQLTSAILPPSTFTVTNGVTLTAPIIKSVTLDKSHLNNGGAINVTVTAESSSPVVWLNRTFDGPAGNIYGGGGSWPNWTQVGANQWQCQWTENVSAWSPSGLYIFSNLSCKNEAQLTSEKWSNVSFSADNRKIHSLNVTTSGENSVTFPTEIGKQFTLQYSTDLTNWHNVQTISGDGDLVTITHSIASPRIFYRVQRDN